MEEITRKDFYLHNELQSAVKLIELGFGEFKNLSLVNNFYYLPFQLLSSGFERLMKCHICLGYHEKNGVYPNANDLKKYGGKGGHDLLELKKTILDSYFKKNIQLLQNDFDFLENDSDLKELVKLLSEFGKYARYYNFDVVTSAEKPRINVEQLWKQYEISLCVQNPEIFKKLKSLDDREREEASDYAKRQILIKLEKFTRAVCRQFTIGKLGQKAQEFSSVVHNFILIKDENLGKHNYRVETTSYQIREQNVHPQTLNDELEGTRNPCYPHKIIRKENFDGDWPFFDDEVTIECREKNCYVVNIENKDYALNGTAKQRYKLEDVYQAGRVISGKDVEIFIQMALQLGEEA